MRRWRERTCFFFLMIRRPRRSTLLPYATLFRSAVAPEMMQPRGPAKVFTDEEESSRAVLNGEIEAGDVIVVAFEGPRGAPGMPEFLTTTANLAGMGLDDKVALVTDGRSEEHTSELQSRRNLVCRLLLEKKK